jgi:rhodanese-related sulfurtransferase
MLKNISFVLLMTLGWSCGADAQTKLDVVAFEKLIAATPNLQLVDVRTLQETTKGIIPNAQILDYNDPNFKINIGKLDKTRPIAVYCAAGGRSSGAAEILKGLGFTEVYDLSGGFRAWSAQGKKTASCLNISK